MASSTHLVPHSPNDDSFVASPIQEHARDDNEIVRSDDPLHHPTEMLRSVADFENQEDTRVLGEGEGEEFWEGDEDDESRFISYFLLSHIAMQLRDKIPRGTHVKGSIPYPRAFTGKDIVVSVCCGFRSSMWY